MPTIKEQYPLQEARLVNMNFIDKIKQGLTKEASDLGSEFIREKLRETGFLGQILPRQTIMDSDCDRDENHELPKVVVDKEPDATAAYMPFRAGMTNHYFTGQRYAIPFLKVETSHFTKNVNELRTTRMDIRQIIKDNSVKELQAQEDGYFLNGVDDAILASPASAFQDLAISGGLTPTAVKIALQALIQMRRPVGRILMTEALYADTLTFDINQVGYNLKGRWYEEGTASPKSIFGVPVVTTIKNDIVPDNVFYVFTPPEFLGKFYSLQDPTLYIKEEADMLMFWIYETIGLGIGNVQSVIKVTL